MLLVFWAIPVFAQSAFDGTWRVDPNSAQFKGSDKFLLQNGTWHCDSCVPKLSIKADGKEHKVTTSPYYDAATVNEVNDHAVEISTKKNGKPAGTNKMTASDDGKMLTTEWSFVSETGETGNGKFTSERVGEAPAGSNKVSGSWQPNKVEDASESVSLISYKVAGDEFSMSDKTGDSYTAKLDGKDYPYKGDPGVTTVSLKKIDANTIEESDKRNGKPIYVSRMTVSEDGKTMQIANEDKLHNTSQKWTAQKQ
jgi:hypothetical protein